MFRRYIDRFVRCFGEGLGQFIVGRVLASQMPSFSMFLYVFFLLVMVPLVL